MKFIYLFIYLLIYFFFLEKFTSLRTYYERNEKDYISIYS